MSLAERLKIAREHLGKSQKDIAALAGASYRAWQGYENGENQPGAKVIEALAKLGINANWLLTGEGSIEKEKGSGISQHASGNVGLIQSAGTVSGSITQGGRARLPDDIQEICELLQLYTSKAFQAKLRAQLLKLKEDEESR